MPSAIGKKVYSAFRLSMGVRPPAPVLRRRPIAVFAASAVVVVLSVLAGLGPLPATAQTPSVVRNLVPAETLERAATQQYSQLMQQARRQGALAEADHPDLKRIRTITQRMLPLATRWNPRAAGWKWEINLLGSNQVNAFCMPGGKIAVFSGLLATIRPTDDELAIVIGHEIAHALLEHGRERVAKGQLTQLGAGLLSYVFGLGDLGNAALGVGANLLSMKFSRTDESEADGIGLELAARAGFNPSAGITLWQKMTRASKGAPPEWFSTHPAGENRIREIQSLMPRLQPIYEEARAVRPR